ncbi:MAG: exodeoxyribonuclease VII small subunit [Terriglobales bacterium]
MPEEPPAASGEKRSYEDCVRRLDEIVAQLERADLPLEESVRLFEEGMALSQECRRQLDEAEGRIEMLVKRGNAAPTAEPFEIRDE